MTTVVADTGDFASMAAYAPQDAEKCGEVWMDLVIDHLLIGFGKKIHG